MNKDHSATALIHLKRDKVAAVPIRARIGQIDSLRRGIESRISILAFGLDKEFARIESHWR